MLKRQPVTSHPHHKAQAAVRLWANSADSNVQHRQESNDGVHEQDADMNNDDKEKQKSHGRKKPRHCQQ